MDKLQWDESLSVGIDLIDDQHKKWIDQFNDAADVVSTHQGPAQITKTLGFLVDYTEAHFSTEEKHMSESGYGDRELHKAKHDELRETLATLVQDFEEDGATSALVDSIDTFLRNWLIKHIQEVDRRFGEFVRAKGIVLCAGS